MIKSIDFWEYCVVDSHKVVLFYITMENLVTEGWKLYDEANILLCANPSSRMITYVQILMK